MTSTSAAARIGAGLFALGLLACVAAPARAGVPPAATAPAGGTGGHVPLRPMVRVKPVYPPAAAFQGYQGTVDVCFTVRPDGSVGDARVAGFEPARPPGTTPAPADATVRAREARSLLGTAAVATVRQWRFFPQRRHGKPVATPDVCQQIAFSLHAGRTGGAAPVRAVPELRKLAKEGTASAQAALAALYVIGHGVARDYERAVFWARKAAAQGNAEAETLLGSLYHLGRGVRQDDAKATYWARKAAVQHDIMAEWLLGELYRAGRGVPRDLHRALTWYRKAARSAFPPAQYALGELYLNGEGVRRNAATAVDWFRKAAADGDVAAQLALGMQYLAGRGVSQDYGKAAHWLRKAAARGNADAADLLGYLYVNGEGVDRSCARAFRWFARAAKAGSADARKTLERFGETDGVCSASTI